MFVYYIFHMGPQVYKAYIQEPLYIYIYHNISIYVVHHIYITCIYLLIADYYIYIYTIYIYYILSCSKPPPPRCQSPNPTSQTPKTRILNLQEWASVTAGVGRQLAVHGMFLAGRAPTAPAFNGSNLEEITGQAACPLDQESCTVHNN